MCVCLQNVFTFWVVVLFCLCYIWQVFVLIKAYIVCSVDRLVDRFFFHDDTGVCSTISTDLSSVTS